jgi:hypothetical protein
MPIVEALKTGGIHSGPLPSWRRAASAASSNPPAVDPAERRGAAGDALEKTIARPAAPTQPAGPVRTAR